jgi:hypothetical protein
LDGYEYKLVGHASGPHGSFFSAVLKRRCKADSRRGGEQTPDGLHHQALERELNLRPHNYVGEYRDGYLTISSIDYRRAVARAFLPAIVHIALFPRLDASTANCCGGNIRR